MGDSLKDKDWEREGERDVGISWRRRERERDVGISWRRRERERDVGISWRRIERESEGESIKKSEKMTEGE